MSDDEMSVCQDEVGSDEWRPRLSPEELAAKYGPLERALIVDMRHYPEEELAAEGQTYISLLPE